MAENEEVAPGTPEAKEPPKCLGPDCGQTLGASGCPTHGLAYVRIAAPRRQSKPAPTLRLGAETCQKEGCGKDIRTDSGCPDHRFAYADLPPKEPAPAPLIEADPTWVQTILEKGEAADKRVPLGGRGTDPAIVDAFLNPPRTDKRTFFITPQGYCNNCGTQAALSTNNPGGSTPRITCPDCFPEAFSSSEPRNPAVLAAASDFTVRQREAAGRCPQCNTQLSVSGECPTHGENPQPLMVQHFQGLSKKYSTTGVLHPKSTLDDYRHFAWFKGGVSHFHDESCPAGLCSTVGDHSDRFVIHYDARTKDQKDERSRFYIPKMMVRTVRSFGIFRKDSGPNNTTIRDTEQSPA